MTELKVIDLTGKEEVVLSGKGYLTRIINRIVAGERLVGEVIEEQVAGSSNYKAEIRDGLIAHQYADKFESAEEAVEAIKHWYKEEEDFIRQGSASPVDYQDIMNEFGITHDDFMNSYSIRTEVLKLDDKRKEVELKNKMISNAKSDLETMDSNTEKGASEYIAKMKNVLIPNRENEVKRLEKDIEVCESRMRELASR